MLGQSLVELRLEEAEMGPDEAAYRSADDFKAHDGAPQTSGETHYHGIPSAAGSMARLAYMRAKAAGIEVAPLLKSANLTLSDIDNPDARLRVRDQIEFLNL